METKRKLAVVAKVLRLSPIAGATMIEQAEIKGWKCIVKVGEFRVGDLAVYIGIDSIPDFEDETFKFLAEKKVSHIKTIKMRGVISQGLLGPMTWLTSRGHDVTKLNEGDDITELMGVTQYIEPEEVMQYAGGDVKNYPFPADVPKTDATRLQSAPEFFFDAVRDRDVIITRKEDGCSATYLVRNGEFSICSRNFVLGPGSDRRSFHHYFEISDKFRLQERMLSLGINIAIQGEIVGPKVSSNRLKLDERSFRVFDIYSLDESRFLLFDECSAICTQLSLEQVPLLYRGPANGLELSVDSFLSMADRQRYAKDVKAEGIVIKTDDLRVPPEISDRGATPSDSESKTAIDLESVDDGVKKNRESDPCNLPRVVFKVISNNYLLKHNL